MYAYKETMTLDNPQQLNLKNPLPFLKGKKVEVLIIVEEDETDYISQNETLMEQIESSMQTHQQGAGYQPTNEEMNALLSV